MKSILLASASVFAFAGAAAAEVSFGAEATVGVNTDMNTDDVDFVAGDHSGFYWSATIDVTAETTLDNGLVIGFTAGGDIVDNNTGPMMDGGDTIGWAPDGYELYIITDMAALYVGDTALAADEYFSIVDGVVPGFDEDFAPGANAAVRGEFMFGNYSAYASYSLVPEGSVEGLQLVGMGTFGNFDVSVAYQDDQGDSGTEVFGVSAGTTFGAIDLDVSYVDEVDVVSGFGVAVSAPVGPVTLGAYAANSIYDVTDENNMAYGISAEYENGPIWVSAYYDTEIISNDGVEDVTSDDYGVDASYEVFDGVKALAGFTDAGDDYYVGAEWAVDDALTIIFSYAADESYDSDDEIGDPEFQNGLTAEATFTF